ncbi:MAG: hypothetical protein ACREPB_02010 [Arenimonas sp.]
MPLLFSPATAVAASLCATNEQTLFSCTTGPEHKLISLCGSQSLLQANSYLQYRFGAKKNLELAFPREKAGSLTKFSYYHYFRFQIDKTGISFIHRNVTYTLFTDYDGEDGTPENQSGVAVTSGKEVRFICKGPVTNNLSRLDGVIPCDKSDPLNSCAIAF